MMSWGGLWVTGRPNIFHLRCFEEVYMTKDRLLGIIALIVAALIAVLTMLTVDPTIRIQGDPGARIFPYGIALLLVLTGLRLVTRRGEGEWEVFLSRQQWGKLLELFAVMCGYVFLVWLLGFNIATFFLLFVVSSMFSRGQKVPLWHRLLYSLVMAAAIYVVFHFGLKVFLPTGIINLF